MPRIIREHIRWDLMLNMSFNRLILNKKTAFFAVFFLHVFYIMSQDRREMMTSPSSFSSCLFIRVINGIISLFSHDGFMKKYAVSQNMPTIPKKIRSDSIVFDSSGTIFSQTGIKQAAIRI